MAPEDQVPKIQAEKENVEPLAPLADPEKLRKRRSPPAPIVSELSRMMDQLKASMVAEIQGCLERVRNTMMDEVQLALDNLWAKIQPVMVDHGRSITALADAFDEMTMKEAKDNMEDPRAGGPGVNDPPANSPPESGGQNNQADNNNPLQSGGQNDQLASQSDRPAQWQGRGSRGTWRGRREFENGGPGRVSYLRRQLERECGGRVRIQHPYMEFRRGRGYGPSGTTDRAFGSYGGQNSGGPSRVRRGN